MGPYKKLLDVTQDIIPIHHLVIRAQPCFETLQAGDDDELHFGGLALWLHLVLDGHVVAELQLFILCLDSSYSFLREIVPQAEGSKLLQVQ